VPQRANQSFWNAEAAAVTPSCLSAMMARAAFRGFDERVDALAVGGVTSRWASPRSTAWEGREP
jgi:hypothetical protein